jgi:hypothetical protein
MPQDAANGNPENPWRFRVLSKWKKALEAILFGTGFAGGACHVLRGSGLPMPRRRTLTAPILGSVRSEMSALRHPCLRWPSTPALGARAAPPGTLLLNARERGDAQHRPPLHHGDERTLRRQ